MSMPPPPEEPTRPLQPVAYERERVVEPEFDPRFALASLEDRVRSLQTGMWLVGLVSLAALLVGIYAVIQTADDDTRTTTRSNGVSQSEVSRLEGRIDELEGREPASEQDVAALEKDFADLRDQAEQAQEQEPPEPAEAETDPQVTQAITDLTQRLDDLEQRVEEAEAQQQP